MTIEIIQGGESLWRSGDVSLTVEVALFALAGFLWMQVYRTGRSLIERSREAQNAS